MKLKNGWTVKTEADNLNLKIFKNIENEDEFVIRDTNDTGALASFIMTNSTIDVQEISWAITLGIDWGNKVIVIKDSEEKKEA